MNIEEKEGIEEKMEPGTSIIQVKPEMIRPIVKVEEALEAWREYQELKTKLADKGDFVTIQNKQHPTKQFANKLSKFFGLSVQLIRAEKEITGDSFAWHLWVRATSPNGQFRESDGHCSSGERKFSHLEHDVYATAVTRAKNRAILELAGFGEVSAEEILDKRENEKKPPLIMLKLSNGRKANLSYDEVIKKFGKIKEAIGNESYYKLLGEAGFEHANQIVSADMPAIYDALIMLWKQQEKVKEEK